MKLTEKTINKTSNSDDKSVATGKLSALTERWEALSVKDKLALSVLFTFLIGFGGVYGGYVLHNNFVKQQQIFDTKVGEFFWLRSQADNLKPPSTNGQGIDNQPLNTQVTNTIRGLGINNPTVVQSGDNVQISFEHKNQATISRAIEGLQGQLSSQGLGFSKLKISQNEQLTLIKVQATISTANS